AGEQPEQRRLAGAAGSEHGEHLAVGDVEGQSLERRGIAFRSRMDAEDVAQLDRGRAHDAASAARDGARPRSSVAAPTSSAAATAYPTAAIASSGQSRARRSGGSGSAAP